MFFILEEYFEKYQLPKKKPIITSDEISAKV